MVKYVVSVSSWKS